MELHEAIKKIVEEYGKKVITERRFFNMVADYHSFRDNPAEKRVLSAIVNEGYSARLLIIDNSDDSSIILNQIVNDICKNYGFRKDLVLEVINSIITCMGFSASLDVKAPVPLSSNNLQRDCKNQPYSEEYILSLYPILFHNNVPHHAHMDFDIFQKKLQMDSDEAFRLFKFLKGMGVYVFNTNSEDYDMEVKSKESLIKLYRNYVEQLGILVIPFSNGKSIKREYLEAIIKILFINKYISVEWIDSKLSSIKDHKWFSLELYDILRRLKLIDNSGHSMNPYLTPEYMVNCIVNYAVYPKKDSHSYKSESTRKLTSLNESPINEKGIIPDRNNNASSWEVGIYSSFDDFSEGFIVSLYPKVLVNYRNHLQAHISVEDFQMYLPLDGAFIQNIINYLCKIGALIYNENSMDYDICPNCSDEMLRKLYRDYKNKNKNINRLLMNLINSKKYRMVAIKLLNGRSLNDSLSTIPMINKAYVISKFTSSGILANDGTLKIKQHFNRDTNINNILEAVFKYASNSELSTLLKECI